MDDILIFGRDFEEHQYRLDRVLDAIGNAGLTLNVKKCVFAAHRIAHLGHLIDKAESCRIRLNWKLSLSSLALKH